MKQPLPRRPKGGKDEKESLRGLGGILNDRTREGKVKGAGEAEKSFKGLPGKKPGSAKSGELGRGSRGLSGVGLIFWGAGEREAERGGRRQHAEALERRGTLLFLDGGWRRFMEDPGE